MLSLPDSGSVLVVGCGVTVGCCGIVGCAVPKFDDVCVVCMPAPIAFGSMWSTRNALMSLK